MCVAIESVVSDVSMGWEIVELTGGLAMLFCGECLQCKDGPEVGFREMTC